jgi:hypothetical protein
MVDIARYAFRLSAWNELAGVDDSFILLYYVKNDGTSDIEIASASSHPSRTFPLPSTNRKSSPRVLFRCLTARPLPPADPKLKKRFLSRIQYAQLKLDDIRPGERRRI